VFRLLSSESRRQHFVELHPEIGPQSCTCSKYRFSP
jgi:hypothetical protein